ncbi:peptide-methionine (S)-S-oxide reductase MsrA [Xanthomonas sacchari]|uniref:peptide-methionine (S)-S-oxide reductase MsrA n=1 Tax=Xanthomonas sacchari TaxID=56458 RepID=UPI002434EB62|nr:peptide-methionine (S)-S-oxide reductase MsrA [Xanthomonas sacchari]
MLGIGAFKQRLPRPGESLPGRVQPLPLHNRHFVNGRPLRDAFAGLEQVQFGLGCEVCSGQTGHTEAVLVAFDPQTVRFEQLLQTFWESHDPTQGMRQGNDTGTQYRSAIYCTTQAQYEAALASRDAYQQRLDAAGYGPITTEIRFPAPPFYYAEDEHQQYLAKNPGGYCGLGGTGVSCPIGLEA